MDRNREGRRASIVGSNGFSRRRHRTNSLRDSPDGDGGPELRERVKKDRESRSKRRRAVIDIAGDDTSRDSADEDGEIAAVRFSSNHHGGGFSNNSHRLQHRQTFPPSASSSAVWKLPAAVPRKARSASTKRSHDWISSSGNGDQNPAQPSSSPARHGHIPAPPSSPSSSIKKNLKHGPNNSPGPPAARTSSSSANELEIEIAEVLFGLMTQSQDPPSSNKEDSREIDRSKLLNCDSGPLSAVAPKRKKPRQVPECPDFGSQSSPMERPETDRTPKSEISKSERISDSAAEELKESRYLISNAKENEGSSKGQEHPAPTSINANLMVSEVEDQKEVKFEIDLMAPPSEREIKSDTAVAVSKDKGDSGSDNSHSPNAEEGKSELNKAVELNDSKNLDLSLDLEKPERDISSSIRDNENKPQLPVIKHQKSSKEEQPLMEKPGHSRSSLPSTVPVGSWPGGLPPMGYMAPLQGVVSVEGGTVAPLQPLFSQPRPKRCATHCHIARNIHWLKQVEKMSPFSPFGSKPCVNTVGKEKESDSAQRKHHILMPPVGQGPGFVFPINPQVAAAAGKSPTTAIPCNTASTFVAPSSTSSVSLNETQYLAILQNNPYPFPVPTVGPNYRGGPPSQAMPIFNGSSYYSQIAQKAQPQPRNNQYMKGGNDDNNPSSGADNRATSMNVYGQNFAFPIHFQNSTLAGSNSSNQAEKKSGSQHQQQKGTKTVAESLPPHTFAISFGPGTDAAASIVQSQTMFQNFSEGARQNMQMMATAQVVQNSNIRISEEAKSGNSANLDSSSVKVDERKSFAFSNTHTASIQTNSNAGSGAMHSVQNAQVQAQFQQQKMFRQLKHQQQQMAAINGINRTNKHPGTSNGSIYSEQLNSSSMMGGKFPNTMSPVFSQSLVQRSNSPTSSPSQSQSPQWKSSTRTLVSSSQTGPSSLGSSIQAMHKNLPQQHSRTQPPMHTQISFGGNQKQPTTPSQGQGPPPTTSSSKSTTTLNNKTVSLHTSPFTAQLPKNSPSVLGSSKPQMQSQQKSMQQLQFFSNPYSQSHRLSISGPSQHQRLPLGVTTNDPAAAIAAATSNAKGGGLQSGVMMVQASPLTLPPAGFSYVHPVPVKPAEQKQPAGNDSLHQRQPEKK